MLESSFRQSFVSSALLSRPVLLGVFGLMALVLMKSELKENGYSTHIASS